MDKDKLSEYREAFASAEQPEEGTDDAVDKVEAEAVVEDVEDQVSEVVAETEEANEEATQEPESYSVSSLAEAIGWEAADLYDVEVGMGAEQEPIKLGVLKDEYQGVIRERDSMKTQMNEMQAQLQSAQSGVQAGQQASQEIMQAQAQKEAIVLQYQQVNWEELEKTNPGEAALHRQKFQTAFNQAEGAIQQAHQNEEQMRQQGMQSAVQKMHEMFPQWSDTTVMNADHETIRGAFREYGYDDQMINHIADPRALAMALDNAKMKAEKVAATASIQKVRAAPKVLKGAARIQPKVGVDIKKLKTSVKNASPRDRKDATFEAQKALYLNATR